MALIDLHTVRTEVRPYVRVARREAARALRWVAERLRDEAVVASGVVVSEAVELPPAPAPVAAPAPEPVAAPAPEAVAAPASEPEAVHAPAPTDATKDLIVEALHTIFDPEIPVDIYELGLIYGVEVDAARRARVRMTLTSPNCPAAQSLPDEVERKVGSVDGVDDVEVEVVFDPPWTPDLMSEAARLELNVG